MSRGLWPAIVVLLVGCNGLASATPIASPSTTATSSASPAPSLTPSPTPSPTPTPAARTKVTFRITLTGTVPATAAFAVQSGGVGAEGGAIYLCSYYGGWPACESARSYDEVLSFPAGTQVHYRFWRELNQAGKNEEIKTADVIIGDTDTLISVTYHFAR